MKSKSRTLTDCLCPIQCKSMRSVLQRKYRYFRKEEVASSFHAVLTNRLLNTYNTAILHASLHALTGQTADIGDVTRHQGTTAWQRGTADSDWALHGHDDLTAGCRLLTRHVGGAWRGHIDGVELGHWSVQALVRHVALHGGAA